EIPVEQACRIPQSEIEPASGLLVVDKGQCLLGPVIKRILRVMVIAAAIIEPHCVGLASMKSIDSGVGVGAERAFVGELADPSDDQGCDARVVRSAERKERPEANALRRGAQTRGGASRENCRTAVFSWRRRVRIPRCGGGRRISLLSEC